IAGSCGGGIGGSSGSDPSEFPPLARYELLSEARAGAVLAAPGRHPIYYIRHPGQPGKPYSGGYTREDRCSYDPDYTLTEYVAELLNTPVAELPFSARPAYRVFWKGPEALRYEIAYIRKEVEGSFDQLMGDLMGRGLLTPVEALALSPKISLAVWDNRVDR